MMIWGATWAPLGAQKSSKIMNMGPGVDVGKKTDFGCAQNARFVFSATAPARLSLSPPQVSKRDENDS